MRLQSNYTVTGIIVLVAHHLFLLPELLLSLKKDEKLSQLVIIASGFKWPDKYRLKKILVNAGQGKEVVVVETPLQSAGANRNVGLGECLSDLVLFMDADDLYNPYRTSVALALFKHHQFDLMLHGFTPFVHGDSPPPFSKPPPDIEAINVVRESSLYEATLRRSPRNRTLELRGETETTNLLFNDPAEAFEVHHAHAIVRREAVGDIRYHEEFGIRNEDGVFARDMLEAGKKVLLTPFVLSAYRHGARAKPRKPSNFFGWRR